jgi:hypothetical protein
MWDKLKASFSSAFSWDNTVNSIAVFGDFMVDSTRDLLGLTSLKIPKTQTITSQLNGYNQARNTVSSDSMGQAGIIMVVVVVLLVALGRR